MKKCGRCNEIKDYDKFYTDRYKKDGYKYQCIKCHNLYNNALRDANPEPHRIANLAYSRTERGRYLQWSNGLRRKFWPNLTNDQAAAEYSRILESQSHKCGLCKLHKNNFKTRLAVDHCHTTGAVRGLLCNKCNRFEVGRHNADTAKQLLEYLLKSSNNAL